MQEAYFAPELQMAGKAQDVVLGMGHIGSDFFGQMVEPSGGEFQDDVQFQDPQVDR